MKRLLIVGMKRLLLVVLVTLAFGGGARAADVRVDMTAPLEDMSLPFWCDWGYDWNERCYVDDSVRLGVGGVDDKVWRAALRFSLSGVPAEATVVTSELSLWYDGTCVAPRRRTRVCDGRGYDLEARPIYTPRWLAEREVEVGPVSAWATLTPLAARGWLTFDVTDLVAEWQSGGQPNNGVLLKLADGEEDFGVGGPAFPSASYADAAARPRLTVWYVQP
jgi:TGF-beta propeptide